MSAVVLALLSGVAMAQGGAVNSGAAAPAPAKASAAVMAQPKVYPWDAMRVRKMANGGESRDSVAGLLATGEGVTVHESVMVAGLKPNPQHVIQHSEIVIVMEGTIAFEHGDVAEKVGPGGVIYIAMGTLHTLHNVGDVPAKYAVIAISGDVTK